MEGAGKMQKHNLPGITKPVEKINVEEKKENPVVQIRLLIDANYTVTGKFSGMEYLFRGAGSVKDVDERDVEYLLSLRQGKGCCGGGGGGNIFEKV